MVEQAAHGPAVARGTASYNGQPAVLISVVKQPEADTLSTTRWLDRALDGLNIEGLLDWANERGKWWVKPPSGTFETAEDLEGSLIAGNPDEVVSEVRKFEAVGVDHLVFDLRLRFDRWFESIELLGTHVLPALRGG